MEKKITVILRQPSRIGPGLDAVRSLSGTAGGSSVVFLCPGCASRRACRDWESGATTHYPHCYTDQDDTCAPAGFRSMGADRIVRLIRESDIVMPL